ncbi:DNA-(apurinic or apyrimidinic site) lyase 2 [Gadus macrocephalus]|uniref:DNA-(apurinic or apyrimidinic site) lyase 2 n=1 Tax=Gadus macrocephalus TaxID=80720 RepID=UPI0028CB694E|nr:DNA-(apurinic or apyrimidinic site) lyase 2 [Gadus macrocephalus]
MKIVTWNINGIRAYKGGIKKALQSLDADIICLQETKVTRDLLDERTAVVEGYNSYFSFSRGRSGYSGVATYCKDSVAPFAAEEGLTGLLTNHEGAVGCYGDPMEFCDDELQLLDNEGRAVITQHQYMCKNQIQKVTVVNVYCPRADPEKPERKQFKLQFYKLLQSRAEAILKAGSNVIILGDVNTSHRTIDHCDPSDLDNFDEHPGRKWLNVFLRAESKSESGRENEGSSTDDVLNNGGKFIDTFRYFHPERTHAFTCWNTLTGARQTNYGTRIDYIFADVQLAKEQFTAADILPEVEGSDHCPVWAKLCCTLLASPKLPALCTRYLPEFAGKQQKLSHFLVKVDPKSMRTESRDSLPSSQEAGEKRENLKPLGAAESSLGKKRPLAPGSGTPKGKKSNVTKTSAKLPPPQGSLLAFFKPKASSGAPILKASEASSAADPNPLPRSQKSQMVQLNHTKVVNGVCDSSTMHTSSRPLEESTGETPRETKAEQRIAESTVAPKGPKGASLGFWKSVLHGPPPAPPCKVHRETSVLRTVKKEGPNLGRQFFVCARPQGHASNPEARCNFFAWVDMGK